MKLKITMTAVIDLDEEAFVNWIDAPSDVENSLDEEFRERCSTAHEYLEYLEGGVFIEVKSNFEISLPLSETEVANLLREIP